jgi:hypothetical protein
MRTTLQRRSIPIEHPLIVTTLINITAHDDTIGLIVTALTTATNVTSATNDTSPVKLSLARLVSFGER